MSKSQETYNKKEKEKKKEQKRKEKESKKEERKASGKKSFEDMIMYVDEFGQFSSTPPDPSKRRELNLEDIQLGARVEIAPEPGDAFKKGKVTFYNTDKGYGFIKDEKTQDSIFFHVNGLVTPVKENDKVTFETEMGQKGMVAIKVTVVA